MNSIQQYQVALAVSLIIFSLNGCNPLPPEGIKSLPPIPPTPAATLPTPTTTPVTTTKPQTPTVVATPTPTPTKTATKPTIPIVIATRKPTTTATKPTTPVTATKPTTPRVIATRKPTTTATKRTTPVTTTKPTTPKVTKGTTKPTTLLTVTRKSEGVDPQRILAVKPAVKADSVTVTIYEVDSQCQALIPQKVPVKKEHPIESAVSKVLEKQHNSDFDVSYRVILDRSERLATIDLRIPANSRRQLVSLSSCEQLALFGSLRQTLTSNRGWEIQKVRFTEEGKEIWL